VQQLLAYGSYVPRFRLARDEIARALGIPSKGGARSVASHDQDATCLGVEAARRAVADGPAEPSSVLFATTAPPYAERTNAAAIHAALDFAPESLAVDLGSSPRSGVAAMLTAAAASTPVLVVAADLRDGLAGSTDEAFSGDAACALLFGTADDGSPPVADVLATASATREYLDRWREPGARHAKVWEERFGVHIHKRLVADVAARALATAGIESADTVIVSSPSARAVAGARRAFDGAADAELDGDVGYTGTADAGVRLIAALGRAEEGDTILVLSAADGADAMLLRARRAGTAPVTNGWREELGYAQFLTWRGVLEREQPRRPDPQAPSAPPAARNTRWKFAFVGSRCDACGSVHLPPQRVCASCHAVDRMSAHPMRDATGRISTFTIDRLAPSPAPPVVDVVVDFDQGGRFSCQLTEADPESVRVGQRVAMTFRRVFEMGGVQNYFWKARVLDEAGA
jgi:hydroxymethylglutaryl-CoA synthase